MHIQTEFLYTDQIRKLLQSNKQPSNESCTSHGNAVTLKLKKVLRETQTLRAGCKAGPKIFAASQTPFLGARGRPKFNQLETVTTFTYRPSLVKIDARNFEFIATNNARPPARLPQAGPRIHCAEYTAPLSLARSVINKFRLNSNTHP